MDFELEAVATGSGKCVYIVRCPAATGEHPLRSRAIN